MREQLIGHRKREHTDAGANGWATQRASANRRRRRWVGPRHILQQTDAGTDGSVSGHTHANTQTTQQTDAGADGSAPQQTQKTMLAQWVWPRGTHSSKPTPAPMAGTWNTFAQTGAGADGSAPTKTTSKR